MNVAPPVEVVPTDLLQIPPPTIAEVQQASAVATADARKEAVEVASGTLEDDATRKEHDRTQRLKYHVSVAALCGVWFIAALIGSALLVLGWYEIAPPQLEWLSKDQASFLQTFVLSSTLTTAAGGYMKKRLE